jgi:hypothetical protein
LFAEKFAKFKLDSTRAQILRVRIGVTEHVADCFLHAFVHGSSFFTHACARDIALNLFCLVRQPSPIDDIIK